MNSDEMALNGETVKIKVPEGMVFEEAMYDDLAAAKVIFMNIDENVAKKLTIQKIEKLLIKEGEYIVKKQENGGNLVANDDENMTFLMHEAKLLDMEISMSELNEIFDKELCYLKLIKVVD